MARYHFVNDPISWVKVGLFVMIVAAAVANAVLLTT